MATPLQVSLSLAASLSPPLSAPTPHHTAPRRGCGMSCGTVSGDRRNGWIQLCPRLERPSRPQACVRLLSINHARSSSPVHRITAALGRMVADRSGCRPAEASCPVTCPNCCHGCPERYLLRPSVPASPLLAAARLPASVNLARQATRARKLHAAVRTRPPSSPLFSTSEVAAVRSKTGGIPRWSIPRWPR